MVELLIKTQVDQLLLTEGQRRNQLLQLLNLHPFVLRFNDDRFNGALQGIAAPEGQFFHMVEPLEPDIFAPDAVAQAFEQVSFDGHNLAEPQATFPELQHHFLNTVAGELRISRELSAVIVQQPIISPGDLPECGRVAGFELLPKERELSVR